MEANQVLDLARQHGVTVEARGDMLHLSAPAEPPAEVLDALREHKSEIIDALAEHADAPRPTLDAEGLPVAPCPACARRSFWRWPQSSPHHHPRAWFCIRCTPIPSGAGPCDACALPPA